MRAIVARKLGPPEVLELEEVPLPEPGNGQVLVRLHATGVNFSETERRRGVFDVDRDPDAWTTARRQLLEWLEAGELKITISQRLPLAEAAEAHRLLESRSSVGKIVLLQGAR